MDPLKDSELVIVRDAVALVLADTREQTRLRRSELVQWALGPRVSEANGNNPAIWTGYNLPIMRCTSSYSGDLVYLDLPFNSIANCAAPIGSASASAEPKNI